MTMVCLRVTCEPLPTKKWFSFLFLSFLLSSHQELMIQTQACPIIKVCPHSRYGISVKYKEVRPWNLMVLGSNLSFTTSSSATLGNISDFYQIGSLKPPLSGRKKVKSCFNIIEFSVRVLRSITLRDSKLVLS